MLGYVELNRYPLKTYRAVYSPRLAHNARQYRRAFYSPGNVLTAFGPYRLVNGELFPFFQKLMIGVNCAHDFPIRCIQWGADAGIYEVDHGPVRRRCYALSTVSPSSVMPRRFISFMSATPRSSSFLISSWL